MIRYTLEVIFNDNNPNRLILLVMGGDSYPRGREFKSECRILDGNYILFVTEIVLMM